MKLVGVVFADFAESPAGGPAQLLADLAGAPLITHTLRRLARLRDVEQRAVVVQPRDEAAAKQAVNQAGVGERVEVWAVDPGVRPRRALLRAGRKWGLDSWRGTLLGTTWFDEFIEARSVLAALDQGEADGAICFDAHQALLDPELSDQLARHFREHASAAKLAFTQAPPGLTGIGLSRGMVTDVIELNIPVGLTLSYRPELAQYDPITQHSCYHVTPEIAQMRVRLLGDTRRSRELLGGAIGDLGEDLTAAELCEWLGQAGRDRAGPLPVEVELELTTDDPLPETTLRPRGERVPRRQIEDLAAIDRLAEELGAYDDRLVVVGGHGDPVRHPELGEVLRRLRRGGVYGLSLVTALVDMTPAQIDALFETQVDVLQIRIDARTAETYRKVHRADCYDQVIALLNQIEQRRRVEQVPRPLVVPSMVRCAATIAELESFYDEGVRLLGSAVIEGYNTYGGMLPPDVLLTTTPPTRVPCRRLADRLMLLADGKAVLCGQDVGGEQVLGDWRTDSLASIWGGERRREAIEAQAVLDLESLPVCGRCDQWFRP